ncbi:ATP-binding protein [Muricauda sp. SCSIO 64092]|uniref:hybrid sensor histidine kinase/response regulator transcription factor n=1 Tax=Allomuricauda sp. SCSIO 64092 TaxID=2908842 RepID=UPI001FF24D92|nr:ATP-binding protein [Muricauda sp. SCSIO 64092]UOY08049.1 ATP-binding protein [Muricauda sp. SCSIO 64092]
MKPPFLTSLQHFVVLMSFLFIAIHDTSGQKHTSSLTRLKVDGIDFNINANVVYLDRIGYLWIGTNNGLYRYDGQNLHEFQYDVFNEGSIPNNTVNSIEEDGNGNLWIGTESYLVFYDRFKNSFHGFYKNNTTKILGTTTNGTVYANLWETGYIKIGPHKDVEGLVFETAHNYTKDHQVLPDSKKINSFLEGKYHRVWFATDQGILGLNKKGKLSKTSFTERTFFLAPYKEDSFLAFTRNSMHILAYRKGDRRLEVLDTKPLDVDKNFVPRDLKYHPEKSEYYVLGAKKIIKINAKANRLKIKNLYESHKKQLTTTIFKSLTLDGHGNLWVASSDGVFKMVNGTLIFKTIGLPSSISAGTALYAQKGGQNILLGTTTGEVLHTQYKKSNDFVVKARENMKIGAIAKSYDTKDVFVGTGGVLKKMTNPMSSKPSTLKSIKEYKEGIMDIIAIDPNEIWVGLWGGGIDIINNRAPLCPFKKALMEKLRGLNVSVLHRDEEDLLWIGTRGQGIFVVDFTAESVSHFYPKNPNGLNSNAILCFLEHQGKIYIGTRGGGINVYDYKTKGFDVYGKKEGLNSLTIAAMEKDQNGNIWAATVKGITLFDVENRSFTNFSSQDGLNENQFLFNKHIKDSEGNIYFTNGKSITKVNPNEYSKNRQLARTLITNFEILGTSNNLKNTANGHGKPVLLTNHLTLPYNENNITIDFTSLDFTAPEKNHFAYLMEGVHDYWIYTSASNNTTNYNGLKPGNYTFKVKSTNSHGVWNPTPAVLKFTITPPFWASNLAILFYVVAFILATLCAIVLIRNWFQMKKNLVAETVSHQKDKEHHKMKMVFFTDISHELRTPLTLIQGTIEKAIREGKYQLQENTAQRIYNNSLRIGRLIDQIMDIRKNEVGAFRLKVAKGNIVEDIKNLKKAFNDFASINSIAYKFDCSEKEIKGYYDLQILEKIIFNLLSNAFKYTAKNGKIKIVVKMVRVDLEQSNLKEIKQGKYVECHVTDNGLGIPAQNLEHIFDRYYQSTKMPVNQVPGTGIGMELVQKLVKVHGGTISLDSIENKRTTFTFMLPIEKQHYAENEFVSEEKGRRPSIITKSEYQIFDEVTSTGVHREKEPFHNRPTILLVDDNPELRTMMREELFNEFDILEAGNGRDGHQIALEQQPNLIISDILMPVEDGIGMLKKIKENEEMAHLPIFMLTAKDSEETKIQCLSLGVTDYIEKPFSPDFLKWKVKNVLFSRATLKDKYSKVISVKTSDVELESNDEKLIKKLVQIVENSLEDGALSVGYLASEVGMSRANLYRKLQAILNETPVNFIKKIRLKRASQLLKKNNMYISEVGYMTGFCNPKYFAKCFSKEFGVSPAEYVKQFGAVKGSSFKVDLDEILTKVN